MEITVRLYCCGSGVESREPVKLLFLQGAADYLLSPPSSLLPPSMAYAPGNCFFSLPRLAVVTTIRPLIWAPAFYKGRGRGRDFGDVGSSCVASAFDLC